MDGVRGFGQGFVGGRAVEARGMMWEEMGERWAGGGDEEGRLEKIGNRLEVAGRRRG